MKRVIKVIVAILLFSVVFMIIGDILDFDVEMMTTIILGGVTAIGGGGLMESRNEKKQKQYQDFYERTGCTPIGFVRSPSRIQGQSMVLLILSFIVLGVVVVTGYLCYQDGALKGEALFYFTICIVSVIVIFASVGILIYRTNQEIGYHEDGVILYKNRGKLLLWQEFGFYEKRVKQVIFYSRNGDKLFAVYETDEGYNDFWRLYQMHVEGLRPQQY